MVNFREVNIDTVNSDEAVQEAPITIEKLQQEASSLLELFVEAHIQGKITDKNKDRSFANMRITLPVGISTTWAVPDEHGPGGFSDRKGVSATTRTYTYKNIADRNKGTNPTITIAINLARLRVADKNDPKNTVITCYITDETAAAGVKPTNDYSSQIDENNKETTYDLSEHPDLMAKIMELMKIQRELIETEPKGIVQAIVDGINAARKRISTIGRTA